MPRRPTLGPGNDNVVYVRGLVDVTQPRNADGSPKNIDNATGSWTLIDPGAYTTREDILASGTVIATGSTSPVGSGGAYLIQLSNSIAILSGMGYYLHVVMSSGGFQADILDSLSAMTRTGRTPTG